MPDAAPRPLAAVSSPNHHTERLAELKRLLPYLFSKEGRLNGDELSKHADEKYTDGTERYDFRWYGKTASKREAFTTSSARWRNTSPRSPRSGAMSATNCRTFARRFHLPGSLPRRLSLSVRQRICDCHASVCSRRT